jgi:hypothetical protein
VVGIDPAHDVIRLPEVEHRRAWLKLPMRTVTGSARRA